MDVFLNEIIENAEIKKILTEQPENDEAKAIAQQVINGDDVKIQAGLLQMYVLKYLTDYAIKKNLERGISREITIATLKDINVWFDNYKQATGKTGLGEFSWLRYHYTGDLFKLGRLQYRLEKSLQGVPEGEYAIETHIPQGEPLNAQACLESFEMAKEFFNKIFPETKLHYFMCDSWLLNPNLEKIMKPESNVVQFMRMWTPIPFVSDESAQAVERVFGFGFKKENIKNAPEDTSLQRALKNYIINGGTMDLTAGYRKI
jgi:hypothetical protein